MKEKKTHKLTQEQRFQHFEKWRNAPYVHINHICKKYQRRYGVSEQTAIKELRMLGIPLTDAKLKETAERNKQKQEKHRKRQLQKQQREQYEFTVGDFGFYYIEGFTSNGVPYGITMEEAEEQGLLDERE